MTQAQPVTPLRQRMLDDMKLRNMAVSTRKIYVPSVAGFSAYHGRSPDQLTLRGRARLPAAPGRPRPQGQQHLPDHERLALLLRHHARQPRGGGGDPAAAQGRSPARHPLPDEVKRLLTAVPDRKMRTLLTTVYAAGLRVSEVVGLKVGDIDSARMTIHVREGKGRARPPRHALAAAAGDPARALAPHPTALLAVPGAGPVLPDHGALGAAGLLPGGRDRRPRQVGDRRTPCGTASPPTCSSRASTSG